MQAAIAQCCRVHGRAIPNPSRSPVYALKPITKVCKGAIVITRHRTIQFSISLPIVRDLPNLQREKAIFVAWSKPEEPISWLFNNGPTPQVQ